MAGSQKRQKLYYWGEKSFYAFSARTQKSQIIRKKEFYRRTVQHTELTFSKQIEIEKKIYERTPKIDGT